MTKEQEQEAAQEQNARDVQDYVHAANAWHADKLADKSRGFPSFAQWMEQKGRVSK